jgi:hypothetical protein
VHGPSENQDDKNGFLHMFSDTSIFLVFNQIYNKALGEEGKGCLTQTR